MSALSLAKLSGSDTVSITINLKRLVNLAQTVSCLVGQQLDKAVGQEKLLSDEEAGAESENLGGAADSTALPVNPVSYIY